MESTAVSMLLVVHIHSSLTFDCMSFWFDDEIRLEILAAIRKRNQRCGTISNDALNLIANFHSSQDSAPTWNCRRTLLKCDGSERKSTTTCDATRGVISRNRKRVISDVRVIRMEKVSCRVKCHHRCLYIWVVVKTRRTKFIIQWKVWSKQKFSLKQKRQR